MKKLTSSVYDCTIEDVEYIYNKLIIHIQQQQYSHRLNLLHYFFYLSYWLILNPICFCNLP